MNLVKKDYAYGANYAAVLASLFLGISTNSLAVGLGTFFVLSFFWCAIKYVSLGE